MGIPTVNDRVVQTAVALLLLPIWEADSHPNSYAYRPQRNAHQAMDAIRQALRSGRTEAIDAELSGFFDSIPHTELFHQPAAHLGGEKTGRGVEAMPVNGPRRAGCGKTDRAVR